MEAFVFGGLGFGLAFFVDAVEVSMEGSGGGGEHEESGAVFEVDHPGGDHISDDEGEEDAADAFFVWGGGGSGDESPEAGVEDGPVVWGGEEVTEAETLWSKEEGEETKEHGDPDEVEGIESGSPLLRAEVIEDEEENDAEEIH